MYCTSKIVVFDLDETLGYFVEFGMFWDALKNFIKSKNMDTVIDQKFFNEILDLYPEFLRPNIIHILNYLKQKKRAKHCNKLMIYTNNQGPNEWAQQIQTYFDMKLNYKLFDQIIKAFKVNDGLSAWPNDVFDWVVALDFDIKSGECLKCSIVPQQLLYEDSAKVVPAVT